MKSKCEHNPPLKWGGIILIFYKFFTMRRTTKVLIDVSVTGQTKLTKFLSLSPSEDYNNNYLWLTTGKVLDPNNTLLQYVLVRKTQIGKLYEFELYSKYNRETMAIVNIDIEKDLVDVTVTDKYRHLKLVFEVFLTSGFLEPSKCFTESLSLNKVTL